MKTKAFIRKTEKIAKWGVWISGVLLLFMAVYICLDVLLRKLFSISIRGDVEVSEYALAVTSGWAFSYALLKKAHVRIDILYTKFSTKTRSLMDILSMVALSTFMVPVTYYAFRVFYTSAIRNSVANTPLHTPLWIPQGLWFISLLFFLYVILAILILAISSIMKSNFRLAQELAGTASILEEIKEETKKGGTIK